MYYDNYIIIVIHFMIEGRRYFEFIGYTYQNITNNIININYY